MICSEVYTLSLTIQIQIQYTWKYLTPVLNLGQCGLIGILVRSVRLPDVNSGSGK